MPRANSPDAGATLAPQLQRGIEQLHLTVDAAAVAGLLHYLDLLCRWNRAYNLTAVREPADMITRHLLDSLALAPWITRERYIDVGTGAGLPGVPLALLYPDREFHLLDSNGKKTRFLFQVKTDLALDNMVVHQARVESFRQDQPFDGVLSRAFASLADMLASCRHLVSGEGRLLAMKGAYPAAELEAIAGQVDSVAVHVLDVPGLAEQRHLVEIAPRTDDSQH